MTIKDCDLPSEEIAVMLEAESSILKVRALVPRCIENPTPKDCPECGEPIPLARLRLGYKICVVCSGATT